MAAPRNQKASPTTDPAVDAGPTASERALQTIAVEVRRLADAAERRAEPAGPEGESALAPQDEALFQSLRRWRADEARKAGMPPYIVATDRVLRAVAQARPASIDALRDVPGFGPAKAAKYGAGVVEVVAASA